MSATTTAQPKSAKTRQPKASTKAKAAERKAPKAEPKARKPKAEPKEPEPSGETRIQQGQRLNDLIAQHSPITIDALVERTGYTKSRVVGHVNFYVKRESTKPGALTVDKRGVVKLVGEPIRRRNRSAS